MNTPHSGDWLDDLSPSGRPAPAPPAMFLAAVRARRVRRRVAHLTSVLVVALVCVVGASYLPRAVQPSSRRIAAEPSPRTAPVPPRNPEAGVLPGSGAPVLSLASFYTSGTPLDPDRLAGTGGPDNRAEKPIRGGDRWDPDQVESWVLN